MHHMYSPLLRILPDLGQKHVDFSNAPTKNIGERGDAEGFEAFEELEHVEGSYFFLHRMSTALARLAHIDQNKVE